MSKKMYLTISVIALILALVTLHTALYFPDSKFMLVWVFSDLCVSIYAYINYRKWKG